MHRRKKLAEKYYLKSGSLKKIMSKIGRKPVEIKQGVTVSHEGGIVKVNGPKGLLSFALPQGVLVNVEDNKVIVSQKKANIATGKAAFGLTRATIANMVKGVVDGFEKKLELSGVGYRAQASPSDLTLSLGFSHPVRISAPEGITFGVFENVITVSGIDKAIVGNTAAKIRSLKPPEPYKGKGIRYLGERIRRKAGKAAKAVGTK